MGLCKTVRAARDWTYVYQRDGVAATGWAGLFVVMMTALMGFVRYMFPRVLFEPPTTFRAGSPAEYALLAICTHLGCTPNWFATENKFKCPCHGSGFYRDGTNFEGPAPRPLDRIKIALTTQGQLVVDKGVVYRMAPGRAPDEQYAQSLLKV